MAEATLLAWTKSAWEEYLLWQRHDKKLLNRVNALIKDTMRWPFSGLGKPEAVRFELKGYWSRRINSEHRLVYAYDDNTNTLTIVQCRFHY